MHVQDVTLNTMISNTKAKEYLKMMKWLKMHKKQDGTKEEDSKAKENLHLLTWLKTHKKTIAHSKQTLKTWLKEHVKNQDVTPTTTEEIATSVTATSNSLRNLSVDILRRNLFEWLRQHQLDAQHKILRKEKVSTTKHPVNHETKTCK